MTMPVQLMTRSSKLGPAAGLTRAKGMRMMRGNTPAMPLNDAHSGGSFSTTPATPLNDAHQAGFSFTEPVTTFSKPALWRQAE